MKKNLIRLTALCSVMAALSGCTKEISKTPLSCRYTPAQKSIETRYTYRMTLTGLKYVPVVENVRIPEQYEIYYAVEYDDGSKTTEWRDVSAKEYLWFKGGDDIG